VEREGWRVEGGGLRVGGLGWGAEGGGWKSSDPEHAPVAFPNAISTRASCRRAVKVLRVLVLGIRARRGTSLMRNTPPLEPYSRTIPIILWWFKGRGCFL